MEVMLKSTSRISESPKKIDISTITRDNDEPEASPTVTLDTLYKIQLSACDPEHQSNHKQRTYLRHWGEKEARCHRCGSLWNCEASPLGRQSRLPGRKRKLHLEELLSLESTKPKSTSQCPRKAGQLSKSTTLVKWKILKVTQRLPPIKLKSTTHRS